MKEINYIKIDYSHIFDGLEKRADLRSKRPFASTVLYLQGVLHEILQVDQLGDATPFDLAH